MSDADFEYNTGEPSQATMEEDVEMGDVEEDAPDAGQTSEEQTEGGGAPPQEEEEEGEDEEGGESRAHDQSGDAWEHNDDESSAAEDERALAQARKAKPINKGKKQGANLTPAQSGRAREGTTKDMSAFGARPTGRKAKASTKKSKKLNIKEEDLDSSNIVVATDDQAVLDAAFLGFVRVAIVDPDATVTARYKVINDRDIDNKHRKTMVESFHVRKADWEHPAHVLVDGSVLDPACLAQSPYPVKDLQTWLWNCPPQQRIVEFLSGNHRRVASEDFTKELSDELRATEAKREAHREAQAKGGQKEITADGQLVDEVDVQLEKKIVKLTAAVEQARMWTLKVYDKRKMEGKIAALALLATNELQPAKAATAQEKVQMMRWHIDAQLKKWTDDHPGQVVPAPGTPAFRKDILGMVMTANDMKEGIANFLFVEPDNFTLIHDLWQLPYFGLTGKVGLSRLEKALGKVSKKDLSKKSSSSMLWRWVVHKLMRDLRVVGTTVQFPDIEDAEDDKAHHMENVVKVLEGLNKPLYITDAIWKDAGYHAPSSRKTPRAKTKIKAYAIQNARKRYEMDEDERVEPMKLSVLVWDPAILAIVDNVYTRIFRPVAWTKFGDWKHKTWVDAMNKYTAQLTPLLEEAWTTRLEDLGENEQDDADAIAVREAEDKLKWLQKLQRLGGRALYAPLLCDKFMEDFSEVIIRAEAGFKLITRTLDPLSQIGVLRATASDTPGSGKEVFNDYLSYVSGILTNGERFKFKSLPAARDAFCAWLLSNLSLIKKCGDVYQAQYLTADHDAFLSISPNQLIGEVSKLHKKSKDKEREFMQADKFPACLTDAFCSVRFTSDDFEAVMKIFRILLDTAPRLVPGSTALRNAANITSAAQQDLLGRGLSVLSLADVDKFPCLAILYRHGQPWNNPEFGAKKGKSNGFLGYAYFLYMGWRVYGDTIGRMLALEEYAELRDSLFTFLGTCCQPNLDDFLGEHTERPQTTSFVNWDHKVLDRFVNLHGKLISEEPKSSEGAGGASGSKFAAPTIVLFDSSKMAVHTASLKKGFDALVKHPLARFNARKGTCSPRIAELARELAQEMIQNALEDEFRATNPDSEAPYVHVADADLQQFLPALPTASEEPSRSSYSTLSSFSKLDPDRYRLYCHGLVAEGYAQGKDADITESSSSTTTAVRRTSSRRSGVVFPQDIDWTAEWAATDPKTLESATLPDPAGVAMDKSDLPLRLHERYGVPPPDAPERRKTRAAQRQALEAAKNAPVATTSSETPVAPPPAAPTSPSARPPAAPSVSHVPPTSTTPAAAAPPATAPPETASAPSAAPQKPAPLPPAAPSHQPAPRIPHGFAVGPRGRGTSSVPPSSQVTDPLGDDPDADGEDDNIHAESHDPPTQVFVPSSSQIPPPDEEPLQPLDATHLPHGPSLSSSEWNPDPSPLPNMVPSTFPEEPSQLPPIPTPVIHPTVLAALPPPTSQETTSFRGLTTGLNLSLITQLFFNVLEEVKADPQCPYIYGEPQDVCKSRIAKFWARVRDRKQSLIPDQVFPYIRDDHADISCAPTWSHFLDMYGIPDSGAVAIDRARTRFMMRADPMFSPVYDNAGDATAAVALATQASTVSGPTDATDELLDRKRRERSTSFLEDARKEGGASPPTNRAKRDPPQETQPQLKPCSSAIFDWPDEEPRNLRDRPTKTTPGNPPQILTASARARASSASSAKSKGGQPRKSANTGALPSVNEHSESGASAQDREAPGAVGRSERVRQLVQGKQLVPRKP